MDALAMAAVLVRSEMMALAHSARPDAPVVPDAEPRAGVAALVRRLATVVNRPGRVRQPAARPGVCAASANGVAPWGESRC
jgi:hypothetical protein